MKVYGFGYGGRTPAELRQAADHLQAQVIDVRLRPLSRAPQWRQGPLRQVLGALYHHWPVWGNLNYKSPGDGVAISDFDTGLQQLRALEAQGVEAVILVCVCKDSAHCHRTTVMNALKVAGYEIAELGSIPPSGPDSSPHQLSLW